MMNYTHDTLNVVNVCARVNNLTIESSDLRRRPTRVGLGRLTGVATKYNDEKMML